MPGGEAHHAFRWIKIQMSFIASRRCLPRCLITILSGMGAAGTERANANATFC